MSQYAYVTCLKSAKHYCGWVPLGRIWGVYIEIFKLPTWQIWAQFERFFPQWVFGRDASSLRNMRAEVNMKIKTAPIQFPNACSWSLLLIHYWTVQTNREHYGSGTQISHSLPPMSRRKNWDVNETSIEISPRYIQKWCWNWPAALHYQVAAVGEHYTRLSRYLKTRISIRRVGRVRKWQFIWTS